MIQLPEKHKKTVDISSEVNYLVWKLVSRVTDERCSHKTSKFISCFSGSCIIYTLYHVDQSVSTLQTAANKSQFSAGIFVGWPSLE